MKKQIIKQPNGLYCLFNDLTNVVEEYNLTAVDITNEIIEEWVKEARLRVEESVNSIILQLDNGEKPYRDSTKSYEDMMDSVKKNLSETEVNHLKSLLNTRSYKVGEVKYYKNGDVVVWSGHNPCIGRIKCKADFGKDCFVICESHNSLHYSYLRYATPTEIILLGENHIILL